MANLFEISERYKNLAELVGSQDIEPEAIEEALRSVEGELSDKLQNITYIVKREESDINLIDEEIKRLQARKKAISNNVDRLKQYMFEAMKFADVKKVNTSLNTWSIAKNPASVNILDESLIDSQYIVVETVTKVDKKKLLIDLKNGLEVTGAEIKQGERLTIK